MYSPKLETKTKEKIIEKLFDLYVINADKYLIQYKGGSYRTLTWPKNAKKPLLPYMLENHLKQIYTVGVFAGRECSKFICFDIDFKDPLVAKEVTHRLAETMYQFGISEYYISHSGGKGYHIEIFFSDLISLKSAREFFDLVLYESDVWEYFDQGEVEFRPSKMGVKLPLGLNQKHYKTGGYCGFCLEERNLEMIEDEEEEIEYLLSIQKIRQRTILEIIEMNKELFYDMENQSNASKNLSPKTKSQDPEQSTSYRKPNIYNHSKEDLMDKAIDYYHNGLKKKGTRHNACYLIAQLLNYNGLTREESREELHQWLKNQDKRIYKTPFEEAIKDINEIVDYVYDNDRRLISLKDNLTVRLGEINAIISNCPEKNQKILTYALLVHSKLYANRKGVFYMTYQQMQVSTGLSRRTVIRQLNKLEKQGVLKVVERNEENRSYSKEFEKPLSKPNKYKLLLKAESTSFNDPKIEIEENFSSCLLKFYSTEHIKEILPRRQYQNLFKAS